MQTQLIPVGQQQLRPKRPEHERTLTADSKDPMRHEPLVKMRVVNRCTTVLPLPHNAINPGEHVITVFKSEVPAVLARVEPDPAAITSAQEAYRLGIAEEVRSRTDFEGTARDLLALIDEGANVPDEIARTVKDVLAETVDSVESVFFQREKRGVKPLVSAEVISGSEHDEPKREMLDGEQKRLARAVSAGLAEVLPVAMEALALKLIEVLRPGSNAGNQSGAQGGNQQKR